MALYSDATALIALGELGQVSLLRHWHEPVFITPKVREEILSSASQVERAMESGWLRIAQTDPDRVGQIMEDGNLHRGEAEVIEAATRIDFFNSTILVDEARAFRYATIRTELVVFSLPQMLHQLERQGDLASCREVMEILVASGTYRWAKRARQHYVTWCAREGLEPV